MNSTPNPGSGFRHQHRGGPAPWGQYLHIEWESEPLVQLFEDAIHVGRRASAGGDLRLPRQAEHPPPFFVIPAQGGRAIFVYNHVLGSGRCPGSRSAAKQDVVTPDDHGALDVGRIRPSLERLDIDSRKTLGSVRRFEFALVAELHRGSKRGDIRFLERRQLLLTGQPAVSSQQPRRGVDLRVFDRR